MSIKKTLLQICNLHKIYGTLHALKGVSLSIYEGEIISLLGVNGAGKTTLSSIIATLHPPTEGDILYNNQSILNPLLTLKDNLIHAGTYYGMSKEAIAKRLKELDDKLGINEYINAYPPTLSGGWRQRYMIARTLMHSPKLIILDEPTVALDPDIRHQLWYYIKHIRDEGISVLLTTHYLDEAEALSDRVCVLYKGEVKLIDTPQNLMTSFNMGRLEDVFLQLTKESKEG
jgi:ABC-2 type transport system ATP-binding protein